MSCPICQKPTVKPYRPFCSSRCSHIDLGRWFKGDYRVPSFRQDNDDPADREEIAHSQKDSSTPHDEF